MATSLPRISGPVHVYISFATPALNQPLSIPDPVYLGTCEVTPEYTERNYYKRLDNEISGTALPLDETWEGYDFLISLLFTFYNEDAHQNILRKINGTNLLTGAMGIEKVNERGKTVYGNKTVQLVLQNQFYGTSNASIDDIPGYIFYFAKLATSTPLQGGTQENKLGMIFECQSGLLFYPQYQPPYSYDKGFPFYSNGKFACYGNISTIASLTPSIYYNTLQK